MANDYCIAIDTLLGNEEIKSSKWIGRFYHLVGHDWGAIHASYMATKIHARQIMSLSIAAVPFGMRETCKKYVKEQIIDKS